MRKLVFPLGILLLAVLVHPGCDKMRKKKGIPNPGDKVYSVSAAQVKTQSIPDSIDITGVFTPVQRLTLKSEFAGHIQALSVIEGQNIQTGDAILKIEDEKLPFVLDQKRAEQKEAEAQLELDSKIAGGSAPGAVGDIGDDDLNADEEPPSEPPAIQGLNDVGSEGGEEVPPPPASPNASAPPNPAPFEPPQPAVPPIAAINNPDNNTVPDEELSDESKAFNARARLRQNRLQRRLAAIAGRPAPSASPNDNPEVAESRGNLTQARIERIKAEVAFVEKQLSGSTLSSPLDGFVSKVAVNEGSLVKPDDLLVEIVQVDPIELTVKIPKNQIEKIEKSLEVKVTVDDLPGQSFKGEISYIGAELDADKKSVEIRIRVANPNLKIKVGMEGVAEIGVANKTHDALLVPTDALLRQGDKKFVYVIDGNVAAKQEVTTGGFFEGMVEIKTGVKASEQVVTRGGSSLKEDEEYIKVSQ